MEVEKPLQHPMTARQEAANRGEEHEFTRAQMRAKVELFDFVERIKQVADVVGVPAYGPGHRHLPEVAMTSRSGRALGVVSLRLFSKDVTKNTWSIRVDMRPSAETSYLQTETVLSYDESECLLNPRFDTIAPRADETAADVGQTGLDAPLPRGLHQVGEQPSSRQYGLIKEFLHGYLDEVLATAD